MKFNGNIEGTRKEVGFETRGKFKRRNCTLYVVITEEEGVVRVSHFHRFDGAFVIDAHDNYEVKSSFWETVACESAKLEALGN